MKKKNIKSKKDYSQDHVVIILEEMQSQFKVFGDGQQVIERKVEGLENKLEIVDQKVETISINLSSLNVRVNEHYKEFVYFKKETKENFKAAAETISEINDKVDSLENKFDRMQGDVTEINHKLSKKVDRGEFEKLEKRTVKVERLVFAK